MKKTILFSALLAGVFFVPAFAHADDYGSSSSWMSFDGAYISGQAGGSFPTDDDLDNDGAYAVALGYQFAPGIRTELEGSFRSNDSTAGGSTGDMDTWGLMLNAYYDFQNESALTPYVGGGIGWAHGNAEGSVLGVGFDESDDAFAYQLIGGVAYDITPQLALTADYRWFDTGDFNYTIGGASVDQDYSAHEVRAGVRYVF